MTWALRRLHCALVGHLTPGFYCVRCGHVKEVNDQTLEALRALFEPPSPPKRSVDDYRWP